MTAHTTIDQPRELTCRDKLQGREKYIKRKREKDVSRDCEETEIGLPSAPVGAPTAGSGVSPEGKMASQEAERGVDTAARDNITCRAFPGIAAYHCKTKTGVKINISLQSQRAAGEGTLLEVTAELKRKSRFRELKDYAADSDTFRRFARECKLHYRSLPGDWCVGRAHERGKRSMWFTDFLVAARMENGCIVQVQIWIDDDCYDIPMTLELNTNQTAFYHTGGRLGHLRSARTAPSIHTAKRRAF